MKAEDLSTTHALEVLAAQVATKHRSLFRRLELGFLSASLSVLLRLALDPLLGDHLPFSLSFPALLVAGLFGGVAGGGLTLVLTTLAGWYLFLPPRMDWALAPGAFGQIPIYLLTGGLIVFSGVVLRRALIRLEDHRRRHEALAGELHQRLAHDLAVVASIAHRTLRASPEPVDFRHAFMDRLAILRETHDALWAQDWGAISVARAVERPLKLVPPDELSRIEVEGPEVPVDPDLAISLSLCVWELAAHARRSGALSVEAGRVRVAWSLEHGRVQFTWLETGGPLQTSESARKLGLEAFSRHSGERLRWRSEWLPGLVRWSVDFASDAASVARAAA